MISKESLESAIKEIRDVNSVLAEENERKLAEKQKEFDEKINKLLIEEIIALLKTRFPNAHATHIEDMVNLWNVVNEMKINSTINGE